MSKQFRLKAISLFGFALLVAMGTAAYAQLSPAQKICYGHVTATVDQRIAACDELIAKEKVQPTTPILIVLYYKSRSEGWAEKRDCENAINDANVVVKHFDEPKNNTWRREVVGAHFALADIWAECSFEFDKAIAEYDAALIAAEIAAPQLLREGVSYLDIRYKIYFARATAWYQKRNFEKAIGDLDKSLRVVSKEANQNEWKTKVLNNRANIWKVAGNYDKALADYSEASRLSPKDALYVAGIGDVWRLKGDLARAITEHDKAIRLNTKNTESLSYTARGDTYRYMGQFDKAISDYSKALTYDENYSSALTGRGLTYERMGQLLLARADFEKAATRGREFEGVETARARLAALDSGEAPPTIQIAPIKATSATSIPTPAVVVRPVSNTNAKVGRRVALVVGNAAYRNVDPLLNPHKDAKAVAESLRNVGFEVVTLANDQTREQMINALRTFANEAEKSDWAMVYYAGHGIEVGGVNYLVPVDATIAVDRDIQFEAVPLSQVLNATDAAKKIKLVVLDACRNNPFKPRQTAAPEVVATSMSTAGAPITTRSVNGRGLAEVKVTGATLVVYAAKDGQVALDGEGGNSPFAVAVVQRLATPGVEINKLFRLVRDDVMEATAGRQEPYTYGSLPGKEDFFFVAK